MAVAKPEWERLPVLPHRVGESRNDVAEDLRDRQHDLLVGSEEEGVITIYERHGGAHSPLTAAEEEHLLWQRARLRHAGENCLVR